MPPGGFIGGRVKRFHKGFVCHHAQANQFRLMCTMRSDKPQRLKTCSAKASTFSCVLSSQCPKSPETDLTVRDDNRRSYKGLLTQRYGNMIAYRKKISYKN